MYRRIISAVITATLLASASLAGAFPSRPEPPRLVNDYAGIFSPYQTQGLENMLVEFDDTTSNQIAVVTTLDLEGLDIAEYATRIGIEWQVGSEKFDNGVVIVVKPKTARASGEVFIATGYGLEGAIPDAYAKKIINDIMIPHFIEEDYFGGVEEACITIMKLASGEISELREEDDEELAIAIFVLVMIILVAVIIIAAADNNNGNSKGGNSGRGPVIFRGPIITGGNSSFGGGFGGSSGGFGGFGGGSFGGGGARGSW